MLVLHCISSSEDTYKKLRDIATSSFYFLLFCIANFPFLTDSHPTPFQPPERLKFAERDESFLLILPNGVLTLTESKYFVSYTIKLHSICSVKLKVIQPESKYKIKNFPNLRKRLLRDINWNQKQKGNSKSYLVRLQAS